MIRDETMFYARWLLHSTNESRTTHSFVTRMLADLTGVDASKISVETQRCSRMGPLRGVETLTSSLWMACQEAAA